MEWHDRTRRAGFSLVELLTCLFIGGLLLAILIPAVQLARESARRVQCASNLRQIALAASQYSATHGAFPPGSFLRGFSVHVAMLPYIERQSLYDLVDFSLGENDGAAELRKISISTYLCPSDGAAPHVPYNPPTTRSGTNFAGNSGVWYLLRRFDGAFRYWEPSPEPGSGPPLRPADFVDGLSNTSLFAEIPRADLTFHRIRMIWNTPFFFGPTELASFRLMCGGLPPDPHSSGWVGNWLSRGTPWTMGGIGVTLYTHTLAPNSPSCLNETAYRSGAMSAASFHRHGVNVAFADGHIEFVREAIDLAVWTAMGTRGEGDMVNPGSD